MRSGSGLVLLIGFLALAALGLFRGYGQNVMERRPAATPISAAEELARTDNTIVGVLGAIRAVRPVTLDTVSARTVEVEAVVVGARKSGRLLARVGQENGRWQIVRADFVFPDGRRVSLR